MPDFSDETLMRFADGELDAATAELVEHAIETDERLAERVAIFMQTRSAARDALAEIADAPVPDKLRHAVEAMIARRQLQTVASTTPLQAANNNWRIAAAATIAGAVGLGAGYWLAGDRSGDRLITRLDDPVLVSALSTAASGSEVALKDGRLKLIATVRDTANILCREFELDRDGMTEVGFACREGKAWVARFAVAAKVADGGYAPAASIEALDAYIATIEASSPLDPEAESEALAQATE
jgi:hypothetical protein